MSGCTPASYPSIPAKKVGIAMGTCLEFFFQEQVSPNDTQFLTVASCFSHV